MSQTLFSVVEGLGPISSEEIRAKVTGRITAGGTLRGSQLLLLDREIATAELRSLHTIEDAYHVLGRISLSGQSIDLRQIERSPLWGGALARGLAVWSGRRNEAIVKRMQFRVVVQAEDATWRRYRRVDITLAAERGVMGFGTSWRLQRDVAPLEIWLMQVERELIVCVRLTKMADRQHGGRFMEREAALRPSVAGALVWLSQPEDSDVFLDPMCGSGTILLERATMGRYAMLLGGDSAPGAVEAAMANFGPRHQPRRLEVWDATALPLPDESVHAVVTNLPWGRKVGERASLPQLYEGVIREAARVLVPGGRMVILTSEWDFLKQAVGARRELATVRTVRNVYVLGRRADIFVLARTT